MRPLSGGALLFLAACGGPAPEQQPAAAPNAVDPKPLPARAEFPAALRGRWGGSLEDCAAGHGATDGLLDVGAIELRFHESRARLAHVVESGPRHILADLDYDGEGETRTHRERFELMPDGALVRRDAGGAPRTESFLYRRCPA